MAREILCVKQIVIVVVIHVVVIIVIVMKSSKYCLDRDHLKQVCADKLETLLQSCPLTALATEYAKLKQTKLIWSDLIVKKLSTLTLTTHDARVSSLVSPRLVLVILQWLPNARTSVSGDMYLYVRIVVLYQTWYYSNNNTMNSDNNNKTKNNHKSNIGTQLFLLLSFFGRFSCCCFSYFLASSNNCSVVKSWWPRNPKEDAEAASTTTPKQQQQQQQHDKHHYNCFAKSVCTTTTITKWP